MASIVALAFAFATKDVRAQTATPPEAKEPTEAAKEKGAADRDKQGRDPAPAAPPAVLNLSAPAAQPTLEFTQPLRRGSTIVLRTAGWGPASKNDVSLKLGDSELIPVGFQGTDSLVFAVPALGNSAPTLGWHRAVASLGDENHKVVRTMEFGPFELKPDDRPFAVTDILPKVSYPKHGAYEVVIVGTGFSDKGDDQVVFINGRKVDVCWEAASKGLCGKAAGAATDSVGSGDAVPSPVPKIPILSGKINSDRELVLSGLSTEAHGGRPTIQVALGSGEPSPARTVVLSQLPRELAPALAAVMTLVLCVLIVVIVRRSGPTTTSEGFKIGAVAALLMDRDTESFSLSRLQFFAWTAVAVFSYLFLALARTLVQGQLDLPEIPSTLPGIVFISAGTSIGAMSVTSFRGPNGTGSVKPSFADLVCSGGVVSADRFQFLTWTIVGVVSFLLVVLRSDPATVSALPSLPEGFLYLSGISAFGYLGGKLARKAGPVIDSALVDVGEKLPVQIAISGRNLSPVTVRLQGIDVAPFLDPDFHPGRRLVPATSIPDAMDSGALPKSLSIYLRDLDPAWLPPPKPAAVPSASPSPAGAVPASAVAPAGQAQAATSAAPTTLPPTPVVPDRRLTLTIINPDGQSAETFLVLKPSVDEDLRKLKR
jgi:hypothetical protein